jgi:uncharacterized protein DUF4845
MKRERGVSLSKLLFWGFGLALLAIFGMKVVPSVIEYYTILKDVKTVAGQASASSSVAEVRNAFAKYQDIDELKSIKASDLEIYKDNGQIVISFAYTHKIKIGGPVSLVIDYQGSSAGKGRGD